MPDWSDTVKDRERGEVVGFIGHNEPIEAAEVSRATSDQPIEDVRRVAIENTEAAGQPVSDTEPQYLSDVPSGTGTVEETGGDKGAADTEANK